MSIVVTEIIVILILVIYFLKFHKRYKTRELIGYDKKEGERLFSEKYELAGKPDFVLEKDGKYFPLILKRSKKPKQPYFSHVMQLVSYCLLLEENGNKVENGFIQYSDNEPFFIPYDEKMKEYLLSVLNEMREAFDNEKFEKTSNMNKCEKCVHKEECYHSSMSKGSNPF